MKFTKNKLLSYIMWSLRDFFPKEKNCHYEIRQNGPRDERKHPHPNPLPSRFPFLSCLSAFIRHPLMDAFSTSDF